MEQIGTKLQTLYTDEDRYDKCNNYKEINNIYLIWMEQNGTKFFLHKTL